MDNRNIPNNDVHEGNINKKRKSPPYILPTQPQINNIQQVNNNNNLYYNNNINIGNRMNQFQTQQQPPIPINQNIISLPKYYIENNSMVGNINNNINKNVVQNNHQHIINNNNNIHKHNNHNHQQQMHNNLNQNNNNNNNQEQSEIERLKQVKLDLLNQLEEKRKKKEIFQFTPIELFAVQEISPQTSGSQMYLIVSLSKDESIMNYPFFTRIENISSNLSHAFGYDAKEMIGSTLGTYFPQVNEDNLKHFREEISRICSTKSVTFLRTKEYGKRRDGSIFTLHSNCAIFSGDNGKPSIFLSFIKHISHEKVDERDMIPQFEIISEKK